MKISKATIKLTKTDIHKNTHSSKTGSLFKYLSAADSNHSSWVAQNSPKYAAFSSCHQPHDPMPLSCNHPHNLLSPTFWMMCDHSMILSHRHQKTHLHGYIIPSLPQLNFNRVNAVKWLLFCYVDAIHLY